MICLQHVVISSDLEALGVPLSGGTLSNYLVIFFLSIPVRDLVCGCHCIFLPGESTVFNDFVMAFHLSNEILDISIPWSHQMAEA